ncbi:MAG: type II secretion system protein GspC [Thermodesulfobacteriota bacterium]
MFDSLIKKYIWIFNLILILFIALQLALIINGKIKEKISSIDAIASQGIYTTSKDSGSLVSKKFPISRYDIILKRNLFGISALSTTDKSDGVTEDLPDTTLNLELLATFTDPKSITLAVIKNIDNNKIDSYSSGQVVEIIDSEKVKLVNVGRCKAVINRMTQGRETIKCKELGKTVSSKTSIGPRIQKFNENRSIRNKNTKNRDIQKVGQNEFVIEKKFFDEILDDPTSILDQARVIPQEDGLRFFGIRSSSIFFKLGIRNGDIMHEINDVEMNDIEKALSVFEDLRSESDFSINLTRGGRKITYEYTVE